MFSVLNNFASASEQIGKAELISGGFSVRLFNGESVFFLKQKKNSNEYHVYKKINQNIAKKIGYGFWLNDSNNFIEFEIEDNAKAYIHVCYRLNFLDHFPLEAMIS